IFSKVPANKEPALLGMDLLRLALERASNSLEAVEVIVNLLEEFGQGGNCVQTGHLYYHNSFLIADPQESWVLETVDKHWAARQVDPIYSISNLISLEDQWDKSSQGLREFALETRGARNVDEINLSANLSDFIYTTFADGRRRCNRSRDLLSQHKGDIQVQTMAAILRDHNTHIDSSTGIAGADICMHASLGPIRVSQSTGSMIVSLQEENPQVFVTGTSAPCTGIFKPVWVDAPPEKKPVPTSQYDAKTLFWSHERLHREVIRNYQDRLITYQSDRDSLEEDFIRGAMKLKEASREERLAYSETCFQKAARAEENWLDRVRDIPEKTTIFHNAAWNGFNKAARFEQ
ncbi:MAG: C69 family dipeptidase, partial [Anaerolineales bacterium]|nr:C69 family dipeptidase [Anaerolineales bacterium]